MKNNYSNFKKPIYKRWWFVLLVVCLVVAIIIPDRNNVNESNTTVSVVNQIDEPDNEPEPTSLTAPVEEDPADGDDFRHFVYRALKHHEEVADGSISEAEATGAWAAMKANLWMYGASDGKTSFEYRVYYYAMYGEDAYLEEFGYDEKYIEDVKEYVEELNIEE